MKKRFAPACILVPGFVVGFKKEVIIIVYQKEFFPINKSTFEILKPGRDVWKICGFCFQLTLDLLCISFHKCGVGKIKLGNTACG